MSNPNWSVPPGEWGRVPGPEFAPPHLIPDPPPFVPQVPPRLRAHIEVRRGSRFEQLLTHRRELIAQFADAKAKLDAVKTAIRNEMISSAPPGTEIIDLPPGPDWPGLTVVWSRRSRIDIKALRQDHADLCEQYRVPDPRWELRESKVPE